VPAFLYRSGSALLLLHGSIFMDVSLRFILWIWRHMAVARHWYAPAFLYRSGSVLLGMAAFCYW